MWHLAAPSKTPMKQILYTYMIYEIKYERSLQQDWVDRILFENQTTGDLYENSCIKRGFCVAYDNVFFIQNLLLRKLHIQL